MARSTYIYIVKWQNVILAGFTVKHELVSWWEREHGDKCGCEVWRMKDNPQSDDLPVRIDL